MTREALNKLNEKQMNYCTTISVLIARDKNNSNKLQYEKDSGKLRGFLDCLMQMNIITVNEMKALYLWFFTEDRSIKKDEEQKW